MSYTTKLVLIDGQEVEVKVYPTQDSRQTHRTVKKRKVRIKGKMK